MTCSSVRFCARSFFFAAGKSLAALAERRWLYRVHVGTKYRTVQYSWSTTVRCVLHLYCTVRCIPASKVLIHPIRTGVYPAKPRSSSIATRYA